MADNDEKTTRKATASAASSTPADRPLGDLGVPMVPGRPDEPQGPEDALGEGPKRGDYADRIGPSNYQPHEVVATTDGVVVNAQRPRVAEVGDAEGKGGVSTTSGS